MSYFDRLNQLICNRCMSWMQFRTDKNWLECPSCGLCKLLQQLPSVPTDEEIKEKLKKIEDEVES